MLIHRAKQVCSTPEFLANEMDHLHKVLQNNYYPTQFFQQGKPQQKTNRKPNPFRRDIEGAIVVIPYIKGISEQYRQTLAKYKVRVFFNGTSTFKSLLMHPNIQFPMLRKVYSLIHSVKPIGPWKKEFQTIEIKALVPSETTTSPQNTQKLIVIWYNLINKLYLVLTLLHLCSKVLK